MPIGFYVGRFTEENFLFERNNVIIPRKDDLVFYNEEVYKVLYVMHDYDNDEYNVFMRISVEEDY